MVRIFDLELTRRRLALRVFSAFIFAGLTLFVFYYLPTHIVEIARYFIPDSFIPEINSLSQSFSSSSLPILGILLAILTFVETMIKGSWVFGALLVVLGSFWIFYDLTLYREGLLFSSLMPSTITLGNGQQAVISGSIESQLVLIFTGIIILFVVSSFITTLRGARILWRKHRATVRSGTVEKPLSMSPPNGDDWKRV
jgi:hypothetical protein